MYESDVVVVPQLLRQRGPAPADDGGFTSGHTNAFYLAALALGYAVPERFQELVARASDSPTPASWQACTPPWTWSAAGPRHRPRGRGPLRPEERRSEGGCPAQAAAYFQEDDGHDPGHPLQYAHSAGPDTDPYADRRANRAAVGPRLT